MSEPKDYSLDGKDRAELERAWRAMPHRCLISPPRLNNHYDGFGAVISTTISQDPPAFSYLGFRESAACPICGVMAVDGQRFAATLHPTWKRGERALSLGIGVWVHRRCFESCPLTDEATPVPW